MSGPLDGKPTAVADSLLTLFRSVVAHEVSMRYAALLTLFLAATNLAACGTSKYENDPDYDTGFSDGCSTGSARTPGAPAAKAIRDDRLWSDSEGYRAGWKGGYASCSPGARGDSSGSDRDIGGR
jgi:hypothetical protein